MTGLQFKFIKRRLEQIDRVLVLLAARPYPSVDHITSEAELELQRTVAEIKERLKS